MILSHDASNRSNGGPWFPTPHCAAGGRRMDAFFSDGDHAYVQLLAEHSRTHGVDYLAWCLMTNHVHLVAVSSAPERLATGIGETHKPYTRMINFREGWRGYLFRDASSPVRSNRLGWPASSAMCFGIPFARASRPSHGMTSGQVPGRSADQRHPIGLCAILEPRRDRQSAKPTRRCGQRPFADPPAYTDWMSTRGHVICRACRGRSWQNPQRAQARSCEEGAGYVPPN